LFYIFLIAGILMLVPDLLNNLAEVNIFEGYEGWLFEPMEAPLDTVTGIGLLGIIFVVVSVIILVSMMTIYRER
jgi:hypothetical protein